IEFSERDARVIAASGADRLTPQEIVEKFREQRPDAEPTSMQISDDGRAAWMFSLGRAGIVFVDPYTGAVTGESNKEVRKVMSELRVWHRWLGTSGESRAIGKAITGACNLLFLFLAFSGVYLWFPRKISLKSVKPVLWFRSGLRGKARNFNWHNVIGFWTSAFLVIFTATAVVMSYRWGADLLYTITGNEVPKRSERSAPDKEEKPYEFPSAIDAAWSAAYEKAPEARSISMKLPVENGTAEFTIDEGIYWNIFGRSRLTVDEASGVAATWEPYAEQNSARRLRTWTRFLHTGESGGLIGQIIGFIVCIGGAVLVWTGFSLAFRRFYRWLKRPTAEAA